MSDKPLWARSKARLIGRDMAEADLRVGHALGWLEARCAALREEAEVASCRILVAGADAGAHPQRTALILARALAESGPRVILIDLSQGAAALSGLLELPRSPGFAELCQQKAGFEDVIRRDSASGLHYLAPGKPRSLGGEWGEPGIMDKVCRALDETYALTLFCAEPSEALLLARVLRRPFAAGIMLRERGRPRPAGTQDAGPFDFPLHWLDQPA